MPTRFLPGARVRHPLRPDWGIGQIQSVIGDRITVNFEEAGKQTINGAVIELEALDRDDFGSN
ncbi:MAG TPA: DUF3553 domain-containing protein [Aliidongia sp.]|nr:DUF3553 domain-containing protein [Aliidongia sp.]